MGSSEASTTQLALVIGIPEPHREARGVDGPETQLFVLALPSCGVYSLQLLRPVTDT